MRAKRIIEPGIRRRRRGRPERGYTVVAVMIGISIVSIALVSHGMLAGVGVLASRQARSELACRTAALDILNGVAPADDGGSLPPERAREGWHDTVYLDPESGALLEDGDDAAGGTLVARQWRRGSDAGGRPVLEVSATAVDASGQALEGALAASAIYSKRMK